MVLESSNNVTKTCKVSVIVPMYNCEAYLPDFFGDMQNQTLKDFEMICVIDGATDDTLNVVKQYASEDDRIRYFYKENGGAGTARNYGLDRACGEYVICIDADDRYSADLLKEMVCAADKFMADEVLCLFESFDFKAGIQKSNLGFNREFFPENTCVDPRKVPRVFQMIGPGPTNKLYRRAFIEENRLRYSATRIANDTKFIYSAISVAKKVTGVHKNLISVQKFINPASISSNREKHTQEIFQVYSELYQWLKERNLFEIFRYTFYTMTANGVSYNAEFGMNERFVEAAVHTLNEEEPWAYMTPAEIGVVLAKLFNIQMAEQEIQRLEAETPGKKIGSDDALTVSVQRLKNKIEVTNRIKTLSKVRYNRDFDDRSIISSVKLLLKRIRFKILSI